MRAEHLRTTMRGGRCCSLSFPSPGVDKVPPPAVHVIIGPHIHRHGGCGCVVVTRRVAMMVVVLVRQMWDRAVVMLWVLAVKGRSFDAHHHHGTQIAVRPTSVDAPPPTPPAQQSSSAAPATTDIRRPGRGRRRTGGSGQGRRGRREHHHGTVRIMPHWHRRTVPSQGPRRFPIPQWRVVVRIVVVESERGQVERRRPSCTTRERRVRRRHHVVGRRPREDANFLANQRISCSCS